ncbi:MAG: metallopeptidase family protein [Acidimicrobiales bacterium]
MQPPDWSSFERLVEDALTLLPTELGEAIDNVAIELADQHPEDPDVLGLYEGIPLTEREEYGGMVMPDRIWIYRLPLSRFCHNDTELVEEVRVTVIHELAHHFGIDDDRLHELGWA